MRAMRHTLPLLRIGRHPPLEAGRPTRDPEAHHDDAIFPPPAPPCSLDGEHRAGLVTITSQTASPMLSLPQLLCECVMPFNLIDDLPGSPISWIVDCAVCLDDLLQLLCTAKFEIDHLHDGHKVEVVFHDGLFTLISLQEGQCALGACSDDVRVEQFVEHQCRKEKHRSWLLLRWSIEKRAYVYEQRSAHGLDRAQGEGR